jgi:hypothetical protein
VFVFEPLLTSRLTGTCPLGIGWLKSQHQAQDRGTKDAPLTLLLEMTMGLVQGQEDGGY